jgi:mannitol/fructose-specific phosphotransferase system IIA component (Ntr-type)
MKLTSFTDQRFVDLALAPGSKDDVIASLVKLLSHSPKLRDPKRLLADVLSREKLVTTGVGHGVAFPHAKSEAVSGVVFAFGRATGDIDFGALDGLPVRLVFLIGAPRETEPSRVYLNLMARLSFLMKGEDNRELLLSTDSREEVFRLLDSVK